MSTLRDTFSVGGTMSVTILAVAAILSMPVVVQKPGMLFGVTVAPDAAGSREGRALLTGWRMLIIGFAVALAALNLIAAAVWPQAAAFGIALASVFVYIIVVMVGMVAFHQRAMALELPSSGSLRAAPARRQRPQVLAWWWEILPLALITGTAVVLAIQYPSAPARIPIHFGLNGQPDTYAQKSISSFFALVWTQIGLWALLTGLGVAIGRVQSPNGGGSPTFVAVASRFLYWVKCFILVLLGGTQILINGGATQSWVWIALSIIPLVFIFVGVAVLMHQYSAILRQRVVPGDATADHYWIGGLIYRNPNDPSLFVERRIGVGFTLNFGNPLSWLILIGIVILAAGIPIITRVFIR